MTTTLSSKGQIVLPSGARRRLGLKPGMIFSCRVNGGDIVLTPSLKVAPAPKLRRSKVTGSLVVHNPVGTPELTSARVKELLADFP
jgi:AbrB family looped-hinge helix DNA binding protein